MGFKQKHTQGKEKITRHAMCQHQTANQLAENHHYPYSGRSATQPNVKENKVGELKNNVLSAA